MGFIHGYDLNGDVIGQDIFVWSDEDLSGNAAIVADVSASSISGYGNISSLESWDTFYTIATFLVSQVRDEINALVVAAGGFSNLNQVEKEIASRWFVVVEADRDTVYTTEEQAVHAVELANLLLAEDLADSLDSVTGMLINNVTIVNTIFSTYDLFHNTIEQSWDDYDERQLFVDTANRDNPLYTINTSGDGIILVENGEYALSVDISLYSDEQNFGGQAWIAINGIEAAGTRGHFYISDSSGQTISTQDVIVLEIGDEVSLVSQKNGDAAPNRTLQQTSDGTRILIRKN